MRVVPLGDSALILRDLDRPAYEVAAWLNDRKPSGLIEAVAAYDTVGVYFEGEFEPLSLQIDDTCAASHREHRIPVCYDMGLDYEATCARLDLSPADFTHIHSRPEYRCYAIGFCPGFPYLGHLDPRLSGLPRMPSPRLKVPPGSVGITGNQTAIYPSETPGGWHLIGMTPLEIVGENYFPIAPGDVIRFEAIDRGMFEEMNGRRL